MTDEITKFYGAHKFTTQERPDPKVEANYYRFLFMEESKKVKDLHDELHQRKVDLFNARAETNELKLMREKEHIPFLGLIGDDSEFMRG